MTLSATGKARLSGEVALAKKAEALQVLDLQAVSGIADYFLICTAVSTTHARTIAEAIDASLKANGHHVRHREGEAESGWVLLDYGDLVVHIFLAETRAFYGLERLWGDAPELSIEA